MKCLKGGRMEAELKEWLEKYDDKVKSFGFAFKRIDSGFPYEKATCVKYKRDDADLLVFCFRGYADVEPPILIDLYIKPKRKKAKSFIQITTEKAFEILKENNNF